MVADWILGGLAVVGVLALVTNAYVSALLFVGRQFHGTSRLLAGLFVYFVIGALLSAVLMQGLILLRRVSDGWPLTAMFFVLCALTVAPVVLGIRRNLGALQQLGMFER